jgi:hypothetical protein
MTWKKVRFRILKFKLHNFLSRDYLAIFYWWNIVSINDVSIKINYYFIIVFALNAYCKILSLCRTNTDLHKKYFLIIEFKLNNSINFLLQYMGIMINKYIFIVFRFQKWSDKINKKEAFWLIFNSSSFHYNFVFTRNIGINLY